jgi:hypothetical protein
MWPLPQKLIETKSTQHYYQEQKEALNILFSRGLSTGFLKALITKPCEWYFSNHHGEYLGTVSKQTNRPYGSKAK